MVCVTESLSGVERSTQWTNNSTGAWSWPSLSSTLKGDFRSDAILITILQTRKTTFKIIYFWQIPYIENTVHRNDWKSLKNPWQTALGREALCEKMEVVVHWSIQCQLILMDFLWCSVWSGGCVTPSSTQDVVWTAMKASQRCSEMQKDQASFMSLSSYYAIQSSVVNHM